MVSGKRQEVRTNSTRKFYPLPLASYQIHQKVLLKKQRFYCNKLTIYYLRSTKPDENFSDFGLRTSDFGPRTSDFGPRNSDLGSRTAACNLQCVAYFWLRLDCSKLFVSFVVKNWLRLRCAKLSMVLLSCFSGNRNVSSFCEYLNK